MTINSEIQKLQTNLTNAYDSLEQKGATLPEHKNFDNLASTIETVAPLLDSVENKNPDDVSPLKIWTGTEAEWNDSKDSAWTSVTLPTSHYWYDSLYFNNKYFVFPGWIEGTNEYLYSTDCINWTSNVTYTGNTYYTLGCSVLNDKLVVLKRSNMFDYSTDGITWSRYVFGKTPNDKYLRTGWYGAYGNGVYAILSENTQDDATFDKNIVAYSTDFSNWSYSYLPTPEPKESQDPRYVYWRCFCFDETSGRFFAFCTNTHTAAWSTDCVTWTKFNMPSDCYNNFYRAAVGNGIILVSTNGHETIARSADGGETWQTVQLPDNYRFDVTFTGTDFIMVPDGDEKRAIYSKDGLTWTYSTSEIPTVGDYMSVGVCSSSKRLFTAGMDSSNLFYMDIKSVGYNHSNYLSFIKDVGVKLGTTDITVD